MIDTELMTLLRQEDVHYLGVVDLIAASNAPTRTVRENTLWGVAQFRSAEGYPNRRPYAGTSVFDSIELLTIQRARAAFGAEHANVQPWSGTAANLAAYRALLRPGDKILAMAMQSGGHLSHGHPRHLVSELYQVVPYTVSPTTNLLDYDRIREIALQEPPKVIVAGYSSYPRAINFGYFAEIARQVGAFLIADISHISGLVVAGLHPNPCAQGAVVTSSVEKTLRGTRGGLVLCPEELAESIDRAVFPGLQSSIGLAGLVSLCNLLSEVITPPFRVYQESVVANSQLLGRLLQSSGIPLVTDGTDTHMILLNVGAIGLSGRAAERRLEDTGILSNRNLIPFDPNPPFEASGLRLGTPTVTARGFDQSDIRELADVISTALLASNWEQNLTRALSRRVHDLAWRERKDDSLADLRARIKSSND